MCNGNITLQFPGAIDDTSKLKRVKSHLKVMRLMIEKITGLKDVSYVLKLSTGGGDVGLLEVNLPVHFEEQIGPIRGTIDFHLEKIGEILGLDWNDIQIVLKLGSLGQDAPPGPCDKTLEPMEEEIIFI